MAAKKREIPFIIRAMGIMASIVAKLVKMALAAGLTEEDIHRLDKPEGEPVLSKMVAVMVETWGLTMYAITVNYQLTLDQMIAAGRYDWVNENIAKAPEFLQEVIDVAAKLRQQELKAVLFEIDHLMTSQEIIEAMDKKGLRPATMAELLAFGATYPEKQREFPIAALGSFCELAALRQVASLWSYTSLRNLYLYLDDLDDGWYADWRFLAVRK